MNWLRKGFVACAVSYQSFRCQGISQGEYAQSLFDRITDEEELQNADVTFTCVIYFRLSAQKDSLGEVSRGGWNSLSDWKRARAKLGAKHSLFKCAPKCLGGLRYE